MTATTCRPSGRSSTALCTCAIEAAATGSEKLSNTLSIGRPIEASTIAARRFRGERRQLVLQGGKRVGHLLADDIGPRREELAELDVGGPEPVQRVGDAAAALGRAQAAPLEKPCKPERALRPRRQVFDRHEAEEPGAGEHEADVDKPNEVAHRAP